MMSPKLQLAIPTTSEATANGKPYTLYHILWRLPMRSNTVKKRYNDFITLHSELTTHTGLSPPHAPPPKHYFGSTVGNPTRTEERRTALEAYLLAILNSVDGRWRDSPAWRSFLALPALTATNAQPIPSGGLPSGPITDPTQWLDSHRELKSLLHDARIYLSKRDQAQTTAEQHEASAASKRALVRASAIISALDAGLQKVTRDNGEKHQQQQQQQQQQYEQLLDGEIRRRKDLVAAARQERDALEELAISMSVKRGHVVSSPAAADKTAALFGNGSSGGGRTGGTGRRVLGAPLAETARTRELDNDGVLQLQKMMLQEQDQGVESLLNIVRRQKQMGLAIGEELEIQTKMLDQFAEDVDRVDKKTKVAKKRADKIS